MTTPARQHTWTIAEAKAKLSEVLRLAEEEGPQRIGTRKAFVVVPESVWHSREKPDKPLGQWLLENMPRGTNLEIPSRSEPVPANPFTEQDEE